MMGQQPRELDPLASPRAFFGAELRSLRVRCGVSQSELGRLVHVSGDLVSKVEKGERRPMPDLVARLDATLGAGGDLIRVAAAIDEPARLQRPPAVPATRQVGSAEWMRSAARLGNEVVLGAAVGWLRHTTDVRPVAEGPADDGDPWVGVVAERVRQLRRMDDAGHGAVVLDWCLHDLWWTRGVLNRDRPAAGAPVRRGLTRAVGELAQLAGWLACDGGAHGAAQRLWLLGLEAARAAGDVRLGAMILSCLSYQAVWIGDPGHALELITVAGEGAIGWPGGAFQALLATRQARAHAGLRQAPDCDRALVAAGESMAGAGRGDDPDWVYWVTPAVLAADAGRARLELGQPHRAAVGLARGLELFGTAQPRNRALHLTSLAQAHLADGEVDGAVEAVDGALGLFGAGDSRRLRDRLAGLVTPLRDSCPLGDQAARRVRSVLAA